MRAITLALSGALALFVAGFLRGGGETSPDPELVLGGSYALAGLGLVGVIAAGVVLGLRLARD